MKDKLYKIIFILDIIFILFIPTIARSFVSSGSTLDYVLPYVANCTAMLVAGILIALYIIIRKKS